MKQTQLAVIAGVSVTLAIGTVCTTHIVHGQTQSEQASPSATKKVTTSIPPFAVCSSNINIASFLPGGANEDPDVATAVAFITLTEQSLLQQVAQAPSLDLYHQITLLG